MSTQLILFITIQVSALIYFVEMLRRVWVRSREYELKENPSTMPFGFIRLRYIIILYIISYVLWLIGSFFLYIYFVQSTPSGAPGETIRNFNLNL